MCNALLFLSNEHLKITLKISHRGMGHICSFLICIHFYFYSVAKKPHNFQSWNDLWFLVRIHPLTKITATSKIFLVTTVKSLLITLPQTYWHYATADVVFCCFLAYQCNCKGGIRENRVARSAI